MSRKKILIVEDEDNIAELESLVLRRADFDFARASSAEDGLALMENEPFDLILLDLMLPKMSGAEFAKLIKSRPNTAGIPIIMTTAKTEEIDIVNGLEAGASDYITKPFSPKILVARIRAKLRDGSSADASTPENPIVSSCGVSLHSDTRTMEIDGKKILLTANEATILRMLIKADGKPVARDAVIARLYRTGYAVTGRAIDVQIVNLRKKLGNSAHLIKTVRGLGYAFAK